MTMIKRVGVAELKARLSEYLRHVRKGHEVTVFDRETPIGRIVPVDHETELGVREPAGRVRKLGDVPLPPPLALDLDVLELLREERRDR